MFNDFQEESELYALQILNFYCLLALIRRLAGLPALEILGVSPSDIKGIIPTHTGLNSGDKFWVSFSRPCRQNEEDARYGIAMAGLYRDRIRHHHFHFRVGVVG